MAKFIGSNLTSNNWGEDYLIKKLLEFFDGDEIIYRNKPVFGTQFDVCILIPDHGVVIFEVKAWKPETILRIENSDTIVIKSDDSPTGESNENPMTQARGYQFSVKNKIRQKTGKSTFVMGVVCFPNLTKQDYDRLRIEPICEPEMTFLKDDFKSKSSFINKLNDAMKNFRKQQGSLAAFDSTLMIRTRQIYESHINLENPECNDTSELIGEPKRNLKPYSVFSFIPFSYEGGNEEMLYLEKAYSEGTKLYIVVDERKVFEYLVKMVARVISKKGLKRNGLNLELNFSSNDESTIKIKADATSFMAFNIQVCLVAPMQEIPFIKVIDGVFEKESDKDAVEKIGAVCAFNFEQYVIEHADRNKNVLVRAGAGTGKTFTMISRIAYICHTQSCSLRDMVSRFVMITFTNDAADQMEEKLKEYFNNYYLLTGNTECLDFINSIDRMHISTIHSYAKDMIELLGIELGYGNELGITSGEYSRKKIIADVLDEYLEQKRKMYGSNYVNEIGVPVYSVRNNILDFISRLHNQSVDVGALTKDDFGNLVSGAGIGDKLHELFSTVIPEVERRYNTELQENNKLHLSSMMAMIEKCVDSDKNVERLKKMQVGRPQYMFVDEFQDTDDIQIKVLTKIAEILQYKLFVVGDVKQCIYRFRGAKEKAFDQLDFSSNPDKWEDFSLTRNYRTDSALLNLFDASFSVWGKSSGSEEALLIYETNKDKLSGTKDYNSKIEKSEYYRNIVISQEWERMNALFEEVERQKKRIESGIANGMYSSDKEREIAILVRENWQAEGIRTEGKKRGYEILTNTGGDLYLSEPAEDMLKLVNALLHYDEADYLFAFASSNFMPGKPNKVSLYQLRQNEKTSGWKKKKIDDTNQAKSLQKLINAQLAIDMEKPVTWNEIVASLRTMPVLQVLRKIYSVMKPWTNYGKGTQREQNYYRQNVDLLFEELISSSNVESLSITGMAEILSANIMSQKNVDSRAPELEKGVVNIRCITVHKSKGLEYGAVILPYCSARIDLMKRADLNISAIRNNQSVRVGYQLKSRELNETIQNSFFDENTEKNERKREEMRILYVAMTRAIHSFSWISLSDRKSICWQMMISDGGDTDVL